MVNVAVTPAEVRTAIDHEFKSVKSIISAFVKVCRMDMDVYEAEESFDVSLPSKHTYLGDLREIHATPYFAQVT